MITYSFAFGKFNEEFLLVARAQERWGKHFYLFCFSVFSFGPATRKNRWGFPAGGPHSNPSLMLGMRTGQEKGIFVYPVVPDEIGILRGPPAHRAEGGASEQSNPSQFSKCLNWSGCRELNPVYMHPMHVYCRYTTARTQDAYFVLNSAHREERALFSPGCARIAN